MLKKQKAVERVKEQLDKLLLQQTDKVCSLPSHTFHLPITLPLLQNSKENMRLPLAFIIILKGCFNLL